MDKHHIGAIDVKPILSTIFDMRTRGILWSSWVPDKRSFEPAKIYKRIYVGLNSDVRNLTTGYDIGEIVKEMDLLSTQIIRDDYGDHYGIESIKERMKSSILIIMEISDPSPWIIQELSVAIELNKPLILLAEEGANIDPVIREHEILLYSSVNDLKKLLMKKLDQLELEGKI
jgi:hypothetical protein